MKKSKLACLSLLTILSLGIVGCGKTELKDGTFKGVVTKDETDSKNAGDTTVEITIKGGKIVDCKFIPLDSKGKVKDENYGKEAGEQNYKKAQKAVEGMKKYPQELVKTQNIDEVDSVSGATVSHKLFVDAAKKAIKEASK